MPVDELQHNYIHTRVVFSSFLPSCPQGGSDFLEKEKRTPLFCHHPPKAAWSRCNAPTDGWA